MTEVVDVLSLSDADLDRSIAELTNKENAISAERRLLHQYLRLLGVDRFTQTTGVPLDGWQEALVARENRVSYERSQLQGRLDILKERKDARANSDSCACPSIERLARALSRNPHRTKPSLRPV